MFESEEDAATKPFRVMSNSALKSFKSFGRRRKRSIASFSLLENEAEARIGDPN